MEKWLPVMAILGISAIAFSFAGQAREAVSLAYEMEYLIAEGCTRPHGAILTLKNRDRKEVKFSCEPVK
jgi:hypothetical protein